MTDADDANRAADSIGDQITNFSDLHDYLVKITDYRLTEEICALMNAAIRDRKFTVDAVLATLATVLAAQLFGSPDSDEDVTNKIVALARFIQTQVSANRIVRNAMSERKDATAH